MVHSLELKEKYIHMRNPNAVIFPICAKTGEGIDAWVSWLKEKTEACKAGEKS